MGPSLARSQQPTPPCNTLKDSVMLGEFRQTVTGLAYQVDQLTGLVQDTAKAASDKPGD